MLYTVIHRYADNTYSPIMADNRLVFFQFAEHAELCAGLTLKANPRFGSLTVTGVLNPADVLEWVDDLEITEIDIVWCIHSRKSEVMTVDEFVDRFINV